MKFSRSIKKMLLRQTVIFQIFKKGFQQADFNMNLNSIQIFQIK